MKTVRAVSVTHIADGTRYRLLVAVDPEGGLIVTWPDARWSAWASEHEGGEIRPFSRTRTKYWSPPSKIDLVNIGEAVDLARRELSGPRPADGMDGAMTDAQFRYGVAEALLDEIPPPPTVEWSARDVAARDVAVAEMWAWLRENVHAPKPRNPR